MRYIFTGTGRCGTGAVKMLMDGVGRNCTHEGVFNLDGWEAALEKIELRHKNKWWGWEGDSSWLAAPFLSKPELRCMAIIHIVRHPKPVIDSLLRMEFFTSDEFKRYYDWGKQFIPEIDAWETPFEKAAYWYVAYNEMIEPYADIFHRIEDGYTALLDKLGVDYEGMELYSETAYNTRPGYMASDVDLNALPLALHKQLWNMAVRYGYEYGWRPI